MNIKLICGYPFPIGLSATNRIISYCKGLVENNNEVEIVIINPTENKNNIINKSVSGTYSGIEFHYSWINTIWPANYIMKIILFALSFSRSLIYCYKKNRDNKIDVIISSYDSLIVNLIYFILSKTIKCKFIYIVDEYPYPLRYGKAPSLFRRLSIKSMCRLFDGIVVMTGALKEYFSDKIKKNAKLLVMPMTVETERFLNNNEPSPVEGKYIAYIGELSGNKDGVKDLIEAFRIIAGKFSELKLYIIGKSKTKIEYNEFEEVISKYDLKERIILTGRMHRDLVPSYLNHAAILALARPNTIRSQGGFPTKLGEYLAAGRPVVCTAVGEIPNYLTDGINAFLVEPDNNEKFAGKLKFVLENPEAAEKVGKEGQKVAINVFNYKMQSARMSGFLKEL